MNFAIIFLVSCFATILSTLSGGGSTLITVPLWILIGYPPAVAQAASKVNGVFWTPLAARNYLRGSEIDLPLLFGLTVFGLLGSYFGILLFAGLETSTIKPIIGGIILLLVSYSFFKRDFGVVATPARFN